MLIQCPFCRSQAQIPSSKEGAKVRCGECDKLYTARDPKARRSSSTQGTTIAIFVGAGVVVLVLLYFLNRNKSTPVPVPVVTAPGPKAVERADSSGWNSAPVVAVRELYEAAYARNPSGLDRRLEAGERERLRALILAPGAGDADALPAWKPYDGSVLREGQREATVRVQVGGRDPATAAESRQFDFRLAREAEPDALWRVAGWSRYQTPEELEAAARASSPAAKVERKVLSDGSVVLEAEPGPVPHLATTTPEQRKRIAGLMEQLLDFELRPTENAAAKAALVELGPPALPALLTALFELPLETDQQAMKVNLVNQALEEITGERTGFRPGMDADGVFGTTRERRESALRQWFAWWHREGGDFRGRDASEDPLEGLIEPTERDLRQMERDLGSGGRDSR